jgi:hypothetical protein
MNAMKMLSGITGLVVAVGGLAACSGSNAVVPEDGGGDLVLNTPAAIYAYLDGKTMVMTGADIPRYPGGTSENDNGYCFNTVTVQITSSGAWNVIYTPGTLSSDTCDNSVVSGAPFTLPGGPTIPTISNVQGNAVCFDVSSSGQSGRGTITQDGKTVSLELYNLTNSPTNDACENGAVGSGGVALDGIAFTGDAVQVFRVQ